ncbi:hypothetical protein Tco_0991177 [Tanacetum coccineum]|uniref:Uncharacterized protein n=1 Tax=Tanacetum coccineum TaxID=301880 RepID=A0ABQ5EZB1_9ASTR
MSGDGGVFALTGDEDPTDEDGDIGIGDSTGVSVSLGDEIFSEGILKIEDTRNAISKEILGDNTQRDIGRYYPKRYWEKVTSKRYNGKKYPKRIGELVEPGFELIDSKMGRNGTFLIRLGTPLIERMRIEKLSAMMSHGRLECKVEVLERVYVEGFIAAVYFRQPRGDVAHLVSKDSKEVLRFPYKLGYIVIASLAVLLIGLGGLGSSEFVHDPQHVCSQHHLPLSVILRSRFLQQQWSPVVRLLGVLCLRCLHEECQFPLPEKVVASGKNGDDGDLLLFRDGPGACDMSAGALRLFISWECSRPVVGVKSDVFSQHPTSNIEDAFSSNFLDFIPASLVYVPALPGNTYSSSSNNSYGVVLIASPTLSLFHDDPFMKVMHAYYAKESPIPPPTIVPPSPMLSPMFNLQEFFLPEELLLLKKRGHELSLDRIEHIEDKIECLRNGRVIIQDFDNLETELQKARAQITKLQRKQMGNNNKISLAQFRIANLEQIIKDIQVRYQADKESLLDAIYELKNS